MHSFKDHKYVTDPRFIKRMNEKFKIDRNHDVPYVAGYSKNGKIIYIDRHLPLMDDGRDVEKYLIVHERTEKAIIDLFGLDYQRAHHIAMEQEKEAVKKAGIPWPQYEAHYRKYIKGCAHEKLQKLPKDLDLTPYKDEHDLKLLKALLNAEKK
jgi:hypothetical protein